MKKTLISILATLGCLACFAGCGGDKADKGLTNAKDYVKELYKNSAVETGADYERTGKVTIDGVEYAVVWSVDVSEGVTVTTTEDGNYLIDVDEEAETALNYVLTATIKDSKGNTQTLTYNHTVPKFRELTWAEFTATEDEKAVVIKGVISGIVDNDDKKKHEIYLQDNDGGYYVYNLDAEEMDGLAIGQEIRVRGTRDSYYGVNQVINAKVEVLNETPVTVTPLDISELFTADATLKGEDLTAKQSMLVVIKGATVMGQDASDSSYYNFKLGDSKSYVRISSSACMFGSEDQKAFKDAVAANKGKAADVTGVVSIYNNKIYIIPVTKDAFSNFTVLDLTDAEKIDFEADLMAGFAAKVSKTQTLQTKGSVYETVAIAWASDNETVAKVENGKLVITRPASDAADVTVKVTATLSCGEATAKTVEYEFVVPKEPATLPLAISEAPVVGTNYKFYLEQTNLDQTLYFTGEMDGSFLATSDVQEEAADVTVEAVEGETGKFYLRSTGGYLNISATADDSGKYSFSVSLGRYAETKYVWDETYKTLVTDAEGAQKAYIGTYNKYATFSASAYSYIGTSMPALLCTLVDKDQIPTEPEEPAAPTLAIVTSVAVNTPYHFSFTQTSDGTVYYFSGALDSQGYYLQGTTDFSASVQVYLKAAANSGEYYLCFLNGTTETYIEMYVTDTGYVNPRLVTTQPATTYTYDTTNNTLVCAINNDTIHYGSRSDKTYNTFSCRASSYMSSDYVAHFYVIGEGSGDQGGTTTPETPTYTTPEEIVNAAYALASGASLTGTYTLTGIVTSVDNAYNSQYSNVTVTIVIGNLTDKPIKCYRLAGTGADVIGKADEITVTGTLTNYSGTIEFAEGCTLDSYIDNAEPVNLNSISFADKANRTVFTTSQQVWVQNGITVTNDKDVSTNNVADYAAPARFYKNSKLTIACAGMKQIKITCHTSSYDDYVAYLTQALTDAEVAYTVEGKTVIITFTEPVDTWSISLTGGKVFVTEIAVEK